MIFHIVLCKCLSEGIRFQDCCVHWFRVVSLVSEETEPLSLSLPKFLRLWKLPKLFWTKLADSKSGGRLVVSVGDMGIYVLAERLPTHLTTYTHLPTHPPAHHHHYYYYSAKNDLCYLLFFVGYLGAMWKSHTSAPRLDRLWFLSVWVLELDGAII